MAENEIGKQLGEAWIRAIGEGALERLEDFCAPDVTSTLLTPTRCVTLENAADLLGKFRGWFGECSGFQLQHSRVEWVGERLGIFYRYLLLEQGEWFVVEQVLYCSLVDGRVANLRLLCSGFQLAQTGQAVACADDLLEIHSAGSASTCALLTPAIKARLRSLQTGQVLEVRVDDEAARGDIEAWCRLSGNRLLEIAEQPEAGLRFLVQKK